MTKYIIKLSDGQLVTGVMFEYINYKTTHPRLCLSPLGVVSKLKTCDSIIINSDIVSDNELQNSDGDMLVMCSDIVSVSKDGVPLYTPLMSL